MGPVSDSTNPVHHDGHVQAGYSVLIITASDITSPPVRQQKNQVPVISAGIFSG